MLEIKVKLEATRLESEVENHHGCPMRTLSDWMSLCVTGAYEESAASIYTSRHGKTWERWDITYGIL